MKILKYILITIFICVGMWVWMGWLLDMNQKAGLIQTIYYPDGSIKSVTNDSTVIFRQDICGNVALSGTTYWNDSPVFIDTISEGTYKLHVTGTMIPKPDGTYWETYKNGYKIAEGFTPPDDKLKEPKQVATWDGNLYTNYNSDTTWLTSDIIISEKYTPSKELKALMDTTGGIAGTIFDDSPILTFRMFLDYEKACFNDSTKVRVHKVSVGGFCITYDGGEIPEHYENIWIHKEHTFKGFIEWYKKK